MSTDEAQKTKPIQTFGTILTVEDNSGEKIKIGQMYNTDGLTDITTLCDIRKIPDKMSFQMEWNVDPEGLKQLETFKSENKPHEARLTTKSGEVLEGEMEIYSEKQNQATKLGARLIAPKRIIDGVAHETDIKYIDFHIGTL